MLDNNKSLIYNLQNSDQNGSHWCSITRKNNTIFVFDSFAVAEIPPEIYKIYKDFKIITNIYQIQHIIINIMWFIFNIIYSL